MGQGTAFWHKERDKSERFTLWASIWEAEQRYARGDFIEDEQRSADFSRLAKLLQDRAAFRRQAIRTAALDHRALNRFGRETRYGLRVMALIAKNEHRDFVRAQMAAMVTSLKGLLRNELATAAA
jgi:hypothetical protein